MRHIGAILLVLVLSSRALAQTFSGDGACVDGRCPLQAAPPAPSAADLRVDARPIARIVNQRGAVRAAGTGTLVDVDAEGGLVITCAHLFREGTGAVSVTFPDQATLAARVEKIDADADLAALSIPTTTIEPVTVATAYPRRGDTLVSCGYGGDGRLWCNRGQALGYVATASGQDLETLELSGAARFGDSGGPVLDRDHHLVAVLFGTNGRVVDGTYCGRVRRFLSGLSRRFRPPPSRLPRPSSNLRLPVPCRRVHRRCRHLPRLRNRIDWPISNNCSRGFSRPGKR